MFAIQYPHTDEVGFVSVMGQRGEHLAIAHYPGALGFHGFWRMATGTARDIEDEFFLLPQLQASFEDRDQLDKRDREVIQVLGLKYRGKQTWPLFRSYRPGYRPWHLEATEAHLLYWTLEQLIEVAPRFQNQARRPARARIPLEYPFRVPSVVGETVTWRDSVVSAPEVPHQRITIDLTPGLLESARQIERSLDEVEVALSPQAFLIGERGQRPLVPFMLIAVDLASEFMLCGELLTAEDGVEGLYGQVPGRLLAVMVRLGVRPDAIAVCDWRLEAVLSPTLRGIGTRVVRKKRLRSVVRVTRELERMMARR